MKFSFKCDSTSLDFIGTLKSRRDDNPTEVLESPEDAALWFHEAGIADEAIDFTAHDLERALELREAVWGVVTSHLDSASLPDDALAIVNARAAEPDPIPRLDHDGRHVEATPDRLMSAIARDVIDILSGTDLIKECSRDGCTQIYVDRSRGGRREWCSMDPCGNRVKAREYRARKNAA